MTSSSRCHGDPARTEGSVPSGRGRLRRSGPPRPGTDRPAGHGKAAVAVGRRLRLSTGTLLSEKAGKPHNASVTDPDAIDDGAGVVRPWVLLAKEMLRRLLAE